MQLPISTRFISVMKLMRYLVRAFRIRPTTYVISILSFSYLKFQNKYLIIFGLNTFGSFGEGKAAIREVCLVLWDNWMSFECFGS